MNPPDRATLNSNEFSNYISELRDSAAIHAQVLGDPNAALEEEREDNLNSATLHARILVDGIGYLLGELEPFTSKTATGIVRMKDITAAFERAYEKLLDAMTKSEKLKRLVDAASDEDTPVTKDHENYAELKEAYRETWIDEAIRQSRSRSP